eukprot:5015766-Prymnesium_polylepis.1
MESIVEGSPPASASTPHLAVSIKTNCRVVNERSAEEKSCPAKQWGRNTIKITFTGLEAAGPRPRDPPTLRYQQLALARPRRAAHPMPGGGVVSSS